MSDLDAAITALHEAGCSFLKAFEKAVIRALPLHIANAVEQAIELDGSDTRDTPLLQALVVNAHAARNTLVEWEASTPTLRDFALVAIDRAVFEVVSVYHAGGNVAAPPQRNS